MDGIEQYNTIFIGYPIWWSKEPRTIDIFLESYDFSGATVIPFCTSHSSGISTSESYLQNLDVAYGELLGGRRFSADSTRDDVEKWLESLPLKKEREVGVFDMENKTVLLNSGYEMPILGLGTYSLLDDTCIKSIVAELQSGGRMIDTAYMYSNEESVGEGIR
ncbi:MAG: aldo/keto reductase, partial [Ruminococcus sp.]|nr:aldo/keto reductase [Ruminococcus sp.]